MKEKQTALRKSRTKQKRSEEIKIYTKVKTPSTKLNFWTRFMLVHRGKKDGKKNIPYRDINGDWISPTIQEEAHKAAAIISNIYRILKKANAESYIEFEWWIAEFEERAVEVKRLHSFLDGKMKRFDASLFTATDNSMLPSSEREFLNAKRESEKDLEEMGIRLRRFNEYQQPLEPLRRRLIIARKELEESFEMVAAYYGQFRLLDEQLISLYQEFCSLANARLSWYWQGVLKKHKDRDSMQVEMPESSKSLLSSLYGVNIADLENRFECIKKERDYVLMLSVV